MSNEKMTPEKEIMARLAVAAGKSIMDSLETYQDYILMVYNNRVQLKEHMMELADEKPVLYHVSKEYHHLRYTIDGVPCVTLVRRGDDESTPEVN